MSEPIQLEDAQPEWLRELGLLAPASHDKMLRLMNMHRIAGDEVSPKLMHLLWVAVDLVVTHIYPIGAERHIREAIEHGATVEEIVEVMEIVATVSDRTLETVFPIIVEEAEAAGYTLPGIGRELSQKEEALKAALIRKLGFQPRWLDLFMRIAPEFADAYLAMGHAPLERGALDAKSRALISLAIYSSPALIEASEIRNHAREALVRGATVHEIFSVVQLVGGIGQHAVTAGLPLLAKVARKKTNE
jgi:alkylhydroperoxidase/carboxymuconolactone decarboxylase family protein YurZ